jgi:PAS domain S-box-containing protein
VPILASVLLRETAPVNDELTRLNEAERALRDSETRLQQVLDASSALVFAKDRRGRYLFVNREFERSTRRAGAEILGRTDEEVFPPSFATRFRHNDLRVLHEQRAIEFEEDADFGDGPRTYLSSKFPLLDTAGVAYAVCGIATDITDRKRLEEALSSAALAVSTSEGETLYRVLARYLTTILDADGAFIATTGSTPCDDLQVQAFYLDGQMRENFSYGKAGTPCELVVGQSFRFYPSGLAQLFPGDLDFHKLGLEAYAGYPLMDSSGRPLGLIAAVSRRPLGQSEFVESVLRIFAARVNAELERTATAEALRASEEQYHAIFNASADAMVLWDSQFRRVDVNPAYEAMYGWTRHEVIGRGFDFPEFSPEHKRLRQELVRRALDGETCHAEHAVIGKDGRHFDAEVHAIPFRHSGQPHVLIIARDITERKRAEEALRASEEQYRAVFNASADALVLWNSRSERVDVNPAYERMYGYSRDEVVAGARARELPDEHRQLQSRIIDLTLAEQSYQGEIETVRRSGERFPIEVRTIPIRYRGEPHVLAMIRDLTERRRVESDRAQLEAQLRQAQKMEAIGKLTGGIAHDFNNLLTSILGYVTLASEREGALGDRRLAGYLTQAQRSCERARDLIQQMLMFSRGQRGSPRTLPLGPLIEDALASVRPVLPATVTLSVDVAQDAPPARVDPLQVEQVLLNLCFNARDAIEGAGVVRVGVRPLHATGLVCASCRATFGGEFAELSVEDNGRGVAPDVVERIFEPFFSTKETGKGTGMGLAMVHGIVHELGGHVTVESEVGRGSRFRVLWPAQAGAPASLRAEDSEEVPSARRSRPALRGEVLVVDDEVAVGEFMKELLETWGLSATFLPSPTAAVELCRAAPGRFDAVVTDQSMPRLTGLQLAQALHRDRPGLPVILFTGYGEGLSRTDLQAAGVHNVLRKPVEPRALEAALVSAIGQRPVGEQAARPATG